jgi:hypothetical protein
VFRSERDVSFFRERLKAVVSEPELKQRIQVLRLLTPQDFGYAKGLLSGNYVVLMSDSLKREHFTLMQLPFDQFLNLPPTVTRFSPQTGLFRELYRMQQNYRNVVTSA